MTNGVDTGPSVFTRILNGEIPAEIVLQTDRVFVIRDIAPQAPVHLLVIPKTAEYKDAPDLAAHDPGLLAELVRVAQAAAVQAGSPDFRLVFNTGAGAGQTVFHVHAHLLGGAQQHEQSLGGAQQHEQSLGGAQQQEQGLGGAQQHEGSLAGAGPQEGSLGRG